MARGQAKLDFRGNADVSDQQLGIPTANIPIEGLSVGGHEDVESGVYYGWAGLIDVEGGSTTATVYPMVMSIGWNPFYKNTVRSVVCSLCLFLLVSTAGPFAADTPPFGVR